MLEIVRAPSVFTGKYYNKATVFLAGSIEMGAAEDWQRVVLKGLKDENAVIFNPRRLEWDSSWEQSIDNPMFKEQVMWELTHLDRADIRFFYFDPNTLSPISLLEFGAACSAYGDHPIVVCPKGFWRKGNVDITNAFYCGDDVPVYETLEEGVEKLKERIAEINLMLARVEAFVATHNEPE